MNIAIVDNESVHTSKIVSLLNTHLVTVFPWHTLQSLNEFDAIILSGSPKYSVIKHGDVYKEQKIFLQNAERPLLGICAGFQLIVDTFGGSLIRNNTLISGKKEITVCSESELLKKTGTLEVFEAHHWVVTSVGTDLEILGTSADGIEVVRHTQKPIYGVQFHPEVITTEIDASFVLHNFIKLAEQ